MKKALIITVITVGAAAAAACAPKAVTHKVILGRGGLEAEKEEYEEGENVEVYMEFIATDTDYYFYVEGADYDTSYDDEHGYVISFIMPDNDVTVSYKTRNSMVYDPEGYEWE